MKTLSIKLKTFLVCLGLTFSTVSMNSCNTSKTAKGAVIGAAGGAVVGGAVGKAAGSTATGAILGAVVGGTTGAIIGRKMDKAAEEMREDLEHAEVERVGEGIKLTFDSGIMFATDSYALNQNTKTELDKLAATLKKYPDTDVLIEGHTDATGPDNYNKTLSDRRAEQVESYLMSKGVAPSRISSIGYGEEQPIANNDTDYGRQQNRRVELAIFANEEMVETVEDGGL